MTDANDRMKFLLEEIDLPERAHERALSRYKDLGDWFSRPESSLADYDVHLYVQGSFAFGTAIRPVNPDDEYDLDFTCKLRAGVSRASHTQQQLKEMVGAELAAYRSARNIQKPLEPKNRCWRLGYRDELPFHMDVVPGIRADDGRRRELGALMEARGVSAMLARDVARRALWITDEQHDDYPHRSPNWPSSNPGGYQLWFASRMSAAVGPAQVLAEAQVDPAPVYRSKTPLQQVVQLLKRHRDVMFADNCDAKPVSIILTTVAGLAYWRGESLAETMTRVLATLEHVRASNTDEILNPVNPNENFADRWQRADCAHLRLKANFHAWIAQARRDFGEVLAGVNPQRQVEIASDALGVALTEGVRQRLGVASPAPSIRRVTLAAEPPPPWCKRF